MSDLYNYVKAAEDMANALEDHLFSKTDRPVRLLDFWQDYTRAYDGLFTPSAEDDHFTLRRA